MCDLWKNTLTHAVPPGAIPGQIDQALDQLGGQAVQVKLYNSGSFFDAAAIPRQEYAAIAERVAFARHVIVESHPKLIGNATLQFRDLLKGTLEVALGLETADPECLAKLNKGFQLEHYEAACDFLRSAGIAIRTFVLVKPPFVDADLAVAAAVETTRYAFANGASVVCLIPTRLGNGALDQLSRAGEFSAPTLTMLEQSQQLALERAGGRVLADTWGLEPLSICAACFPERVRRLADINLSQAPLPRVQCTLCASGALHAVARSVKSVCR
jgi:radical SAM enzyme (TIGR01210 family)